MKKQTRKEKLDAEKHHHQKLRTDPEYREHRAMLAAYAKAHPLAEKEKKLDENTRLGYSMAEMAYEAGWRASKSYVDIPRGRGHKMAPYTLEGDCITSHILKRQSMREQTHSYFSRSPFWKRLMKDIVGMSHYSGAEIPSVLALAQQANGLIPEEKNYDGCLIDPPTTEADVSWSVKARWGVTFLKASIYGMIEMELEKDPNYIPKACVSFEVEWEVDRQDWPKKYELRVPFDVLDNYTDEKYDAWVAEITAEKTAARTERETQQLKALMRRHPEFAALEFKNK